MIRTPAYRAYLTDVLRLSELFGGLEKFGWEDWQPDGPGHMKSPGGRRLSNAVFARMKGAGGADKPAAKATAPAPAAAPASAPKVVPQDGWETNPMKVRDYAVRLIQAGVLQDGPEITEAFKMENRDKLLKIVKNAIAPKAQPAPPKPPAESLASQIAGRLRAGQPFTAKELFGLADATYGRTRAQGGYGPSDAYDALEAGVNLALKGNTDPTADAAGAAKQTQNILDDVLRQLPTQTNRSGNKDAFQQFSTPPHYSYVAAWLANLNPKDVVLEPSGGTGSLAVHAANSGASVVANELDPKRAALLKAVTGGAVYNENAEQISAILAGKVKPTAVVMNPPFSATAGRLAKKDLGTAGKHIDESLALLAPGGRLVAIVGEGMNDEPRKAGGRNRGATTVSPVYAKWFASLAERGYTLRANVGVAGKEYAKYGTGFGTRILIIDKEQPDGRPAVRGDVATVGELIPLLEGVRNDRPQPTGPTPGDASGRAAPTGAAAGGPSGSAAVGGLDARGAAGGVGSGGVRGRAAAANAGVGGVAPGAGLRTAASGGGVAGGVAGARRAAAGTAAGSGGLGSGNIGADGKPAGKSGDRVPRLSPPERLTIQAADAPPAPPEPGFTGIAPNGVRFVNGVAQKSKPDDQPAGDMGESLFEGYQPAVRFAGAKPHPAKLDESAAMSAIKPPPVTYAPTISPDVIASGALSDAALENVAYAGQSHGQFLEPDDKGVRYRRGYFIGDGTGAGKGRQVAGVIADNWNQGRKKHVWVSLKSPLLEDARRDWRDVGMDEKQVVPFDKLKDGDKAPAEGIAFVTYDTLKSKPKDPTAPTNLQRLAAWLGSDFDGVIAFDEAHAMANSIATEGERGEKKASQKALAGVELQKLLPNARVVYVSATGATEVSNLAYADRLGLWGKGTAFADKNQFIGDMTEGGVAAMEAVAQSLKAGGLYNARSLSLNDGTPKGQVTYDRLTHSLSADQQEQYDAAADGWQTVLQNIDAALAVTGGKDDRFARAAAKSQFWGAQQRFFNQMMTSMQTPSVINAMERDIAEGRAPVVQLVNTMEAATKRAVDKADDGDYENIDVSPREILMGYIEKSFPVHRYEQYTDEAGNTQTRIVKDSAGNAAEDPQAVAMRERLLDQLGTLRIPESPLDQIINHFGPDAVAEATGRGERLVFRAQPDGSMKRVLESRNPAIANVSEAAAFQGGKKKLLVFSDAGGTGRSYHADRTAANQKKRVHYMLQPGWRADNAVQGLGRTHRTNQAEAPHYRLVEIEQLKAQKRFVSTIARRLDQLGALTRGQRQAGSGGLFSAADNLESREAKQALESLFTDIEANRVPDLPYRETMQQLGFATEDNQGRPKKVETPPMSQFLNRLLSLRVAKQGKVFEEFDGRLQKVVEAAVTNGTLDQGVENYRAERLVKRDDKVVYTDPKTGAETRLVSATAFTRPYYRPFAANKKMKDLIGFYRNAATGEVRAASKWPDKTDTHTGAVVKQVGLYGPGGLDRKHPSPYELQQPTKWEAVDETTAQAEWQKELAALPEFIETEEHFLTGSLLPVWDRIPKTDRPKIYRFKPEGEARANVGRHIPSNQLETLTKNLGVQVDRPDLAPDRVHAALEGGRKAARLVNGWRLKPVRVGNERRIEIVGPGYSDQNLLTADGVIRERVGYDTRLFIPTGPAGVEVLKRIVGLKPVAEVNDVSQFSESAGVQGRRPFEAFGWDDWKQDAGGKWRSPGGRVLSDPVYQRMRGRKQHIPALAKATADAGRMAAAGNSPSVLDRPAPPAPAPQPTAPPATVLPPGMDANAMARQRHAARLAARAAQPPRLSPLESLMAMPAAERDRELLRRSAGGSPPEQAAVRAAASVPPAPQVTAAVDAQRPALDAEHGQRASRIFRAVADAFGRIGTALKDPRLLAPVVGSALGAGAGAAVGALIGGPFGLGAGTSIGAGLGLMIGDKLGKSMSVARLRVAVRKAMSQTVPAAAGTLAGAGTAAVAWPVAAAGASWGMSPAGVTATVLGMSPWDWVAKAAGAPFRLAGMVYGKLKQAIEPSAAKARVRGFAETAAADPVQTAKQVMTAAGIDTAGIADEKIALALAVASAVEDFGGGDQPTAERPQAVETFGWEDWKPEAGGKRWRSPGGRVLSDPVFQRVSKRGRGGAGKAGQPQATPAAQPAASQQQAAPQTATQQPQAAPTTTQTIRRNMLVRAAQAVGGALKKADSAVGRAVGNVGSKGLAWKKKKAAALKAKAAEGKLGSAMQWLTNTDVGQRTLRDLERRSERVEKTLLEMGAAGYVRGKIGGVKRVLRDTYAGFLKNRRRYGLLPAVAIETAVLGMTVVLPKVATAGAAVVAATAGSAAGPAGAAAGGAAGLVLSQGLMGFVARKVFGKAGAAMTRAAAESAAAWVTRARLGESEARRRVRERRAVKKKWAAGRTAIANRRPGTAIPPIPRMGFAEVAPAQPTIADVAREVADRLRLAGVEPPPVGELVGVLGGVFDAMRGAGEPDAVPAVAA